MIRISSLLGQRVVTERGRRLGRVEEIHADDKGVVTSIVLGTRGWLEREGAGGGAKRIAWEKVMELGKRQIVVRDAGH